MNTAAVTADVIARVLQRGAESIRLGLGIDGDWTPIATYIDGKGATRFLVIPDLNTDQRYAAIAIVADKLRADEATCFGLIHSVWMVTADAAELTAIVEGRAPRPRDHPDRQERLQIVTIDELGQTVAYWSVITRRPGSPHPTLSKWEQSPSSASGSIIEPLQEAMKRG